MMAEEYSWMPPVSRWMEEEKKIRRSLRKNKGTGGQGDCDRRVPGYICIISRAECQPGTDSVRRRKYFLGLKVKDDNAAEGRG